MTDIVAKKKRSEIMRAIKSKDSLMEQELKKILERKGYKFQTNVKKL